MTSNHQSSTSDKPPLFLQHSFPPSVRWPLITNKWSRERRAWHRHPASHGTPCLALQHTGSPGEDFI